jgi:hypothetical protein
MDRGRGSLARIEGASALLLVGCVSSRVVRSRSGRRTAAPGPVPPRRGRRDGAAGDLRSARRDSARVPRRLVGRPGRPRGRRTRRVCFLRLQGGTGPSRQARAPGRGRKTRRSIRSLRSLAPEGHRRIRRSPRGRPVAGRQLRRPGPAPVGLRLTSARTGALGSGCNRQIRRRLQTRRDPNGEPDAPSVRTRARR